MVTLKLKKNTDFFISQNYIIYNKSFTFLAVLDFEIVVNLQKRNQKWRNLRRSLDEPPSRHG